MPVPMTKLPSINIHSDMLLVVPVDCDIGGLFAIAKGACSAPFRGLGLNYI